MWELYPQDYSILQSNIIMRDLSTSPSLGESLIR